MKDIDGNEIEVGDLVKVLSIDSDLLQHGLDDEERPLHEAMIDNDYVVDEIVCDGEKASVTIESQRQEGLMIGGLYMRPDQFRLVLKGSRESTT